MSEFIKRVFCVPCGERHDAVVRLDEENFPVTTWLYPPDRHYAVGPVAKLVGEVGEMFADLVSRGHYDQAAEVAGKVLWMRDPKEPDDAAE